MKIALPRQPLRLGEENEIGISLKGPSVSALLVGQVVRGADGVPFNSSDEGQKLVVEQHPDGSTYVRVTPMFLGTVELEFFAAFADGGFERKDVEARVTALRPPRRLELKALAAFRGEFGMKVGRRQRVWVEAAYDGVERPIPLSTKDVQFSVRQTTGGTAVHFDTATGHVESLRLGDALIEASYGGAKDTMCVRVRETEASGRDNCEELRAGGNGVLPTEQNADAPGADWNSKLPYTATDRRGGRFVASERVEIEPAAMKIAEENAVTLKIRGGTVARVECENGSAACVPRGLSSDPIQPVTFNSAKNGDVVVGVFASQLGEQKFDFTVYFADGGVARRSLDTTVEFGSKPPRAINQPCGQDSYGNPNLPIRLLMPEGKEPYVASEQLWIDACYDGVPSFVVLPPEKLSYRVWSDAGEPAIRVDPASGQVTPLRAGQALLEREFHGLKSETCFVVDAGGKPGAGDLSNCRALRAMHGAALPELGSELAGAPLPEVRRAQMLERAVLSPHSRDRFNADERLEIPLQGVSLPLGEPAHLSVRVSGPEVLRTEVYQQLADYTGGHARTLYEDAETFESTNFAPTAYGTIEQAPDGSEFIKLVAQQLGTAEFRISVLFADGGVAERRIRVPVNLPEHPPRQLMNTLDGSRLTSSTPVTTMHLLATTPNNTRWMYPVVSYGEGRWPVRLDPADVTFSVEQAADPAIRLDTATGSVTGLHFGHALIQTRFGGAESETCVVVMESLTVGDASNCEELRRPVTQ